MIHGLAGSAGLTLLVLTEVVRGGSRLLGIGYLMVFGIGSTTECFAMSMLISLPFAFTARRFERVNGSVRLLTALFSVAFGIYYVWATIRSR
jgi:high-affinity nickel-transport protein